MATQPPAIAALALLIVLAVALVTTHEPSAVRPSISVPSRPEAQEDGLPTGRSFCVLGIVDSSRPEQSARCWPTSLLYRCSSGLADYAARAYHRRPAGIGTFPSTGGCAAHEPMPLAPCHAR